MLPENGLSKFTKNHAKIHCQNLFFHWDSRYGPYEEDFVPSFIIFDHCMPFLSTELFLGQELLTQQKTPFFLQNRLKFNGGVKSEAIFICQNLTYSIKLYLYQSYMMINNGRHGPQLFKTSIMNIAYILLSTEDSTNMLKEECTRLSLCDVYFKTFYL